MASNLNEALCRSASWLWASDASAASKSSTAPCIAYSAHYNGFDGEQHACWLGLLPPVLCDAARKTQPMRAPLATVSGVSVTLLSSLTDAAQSNGQLKVAAWLDHSPAYRTLRSVHGTAGAMHGRPARGSGTRDMYSAGCL